MDFNLTKKPDLVLFAKEYFQGNYILSLALFFTIILIWEYIFQHLDMKDPLQQSYRNIALGSDVFIESSISLHFLWLRLASFYDGLLGCFAGS